MKRIFLIFIPLFVFASCKTQKSGTTFIKPIQKPQVIKENILLKKYPAAQDYIEHFKDIAVLEMNKYGIPASITLAQGLLESGNGNSSLAREANNHFGIKCGSEWKGRTILKDDDEKDDCFRVYNTPEESFRDHSEFLLRKRYASLFELNRNDFRGWAQGLKQAGYATNPKYADLLISLIDRYDLGQYDRKETQVAKIKREDRVLEEVVNNIPEEKNSAESKPAVSMKIYEVKTGDTLNILSKRFGLTEEELKILNSLESDKLNPGQLLLVSK
ncbi:MAG TPA: glucosaminidase domain-containing protein [Sphingobacteriaceae bacterium]|nr:glucosaminidase domain-containing protein [Sphingobacteriaceae bacterium]